MRLKVGDIVYRQGWPLCLGIIAEECPGYGWDGGYMVTWFNGSVFSHPVSDKRLVKV